MHREVRLKKLGLISDYGIFLKGGYEDGEW